MNGRAGAGEAGEPVLNIGGVTRLADLAVAHHVDAERRLLGHHILDRAAHAGIEGVAVIGLAIFLGDEKIHHIVGPRQAADMGGQNSLAAMSHGLPQFLFRIS